MAFMTVVAIAFGFVLWLMTAQQTEAAILSKGAYDEILTTVRRRFERGDLDREEYERILRVLR